jgi:tRNA G18 (ribose-2'-O)-methylase SpoU
MALTFAEEELKQHNYEMYNVHDHLKGKSVEELKQINQQDRLPYGVAVINLTGSLNIGVIIRTACNLGAERVIVFGRRKYDARSCVGSHNYIPVERIGGFVEEMAPEMQIDPVKFLQTMTDFNYMPVFLETPCKYEIGDLSWQGTAKLAHMGGPKPCLVFGSESKGIPETIMSQGLTYSVPQLGVIRSYNVSAAASIAMWEMYKAMRNVK